MRDSWRWRYFLAYLSWRSSFPGDSHVSQFISELGATGAPHEMLVRVGGFLPAGIFVCVFAVAAFMRLPRSGLTTFGLVGMFIYALGYVACALLPCDAVRRPARAATLRRETWQSAFAPRHEV